MFICKNKNCTNFFYNIIRMLGKHCHVWETPGRGIDAFIIIFFFYESRVLTCWLARGYGTNSRYFDLISHWAVTRLFVFSLNLLHRGIYIEVADLGSVLPRSIQYWFMKVIFQQKRLSFSVSSSKWTFSMWWCLVWPQHYECLIVLFLLFWLSVLLFVGLPLGHSYNGQRAF